MPVPDPFVFSDFICLSVPPVNCPTQRSPFPSEKPIPSEQKTEALPETIRRAEAKAAYPRWVPGVFFCFRKSSVKTWGGLVFEACPGFEVVFKSPGKMGAKVPLGPPLFSVYKGPGAPGPPWGIKIGKSVKNPPWLWPHHFD